MFPPLPKIPRLDATSLNVELPPLAEMFPPWTPVALDLALDLDAQ
jgi:hypothetical protein